MSEQNFDLTTQARHIWERNEGGEEINYLKEMITSQTSVLGGLSALAAGAILSIPLGLGFAAIPVLGYAAAQAIAALFVPSSPVFRQKVELRKRRESREQARQHLGQEITSRVGADASNWATYQRMCDRLESLRELVKHRESALSEPDVERLEDATVDYLGLWLARIVMSERRNTVDVRKLQRKIAQIVAQIERTESALEARKLEKAKADLERILNRQDALWTRETSVEAAMLSMADTFEEVYQRLMTNPKSVDVAEQLNSAVDRMAIEEELDLAVDRELDELLHKRRKAARRKSSA